MISPKDAEQLSNCGLDFEKIENEIDESIKSFHGWYPWEQAIVDGEYPVPIRNEIAKRYKDAGWKYVYHKTSSENGERAGLTSFLFSNEELIEKYVVGYFQV